MTNTTAISDFFSTNHAILKKYLWGMLLIIAGTLITATWLEKYEIVGIAVFLPVVLFCITNPRWAVYQFVFFIFFTPVIVEDIPLTLIDISAGIVVMSALLDVLLNTRLPKRFPPLLINFVLFLSAVGIAAIFSFEPVNAIRPLSKILFNTITFLSLFRLSSKVHIDDILRLFFWLMVVHACIALVPFIASKGTIRSFGLSPKTLDDLAMITLPIGVVFYLRAPRTKGFVYAVANVIVFSSLLATQSRLSIIFGVVFSLIAIWLYLRRTKKLSQGADASPSVFHIARKRVLILVSFTVTIIGVVVMTIPGLFAGIMERFDEIIMLNTGGTIHLRLELWKTALLTLREHPLLGIGPGTFRIADQVIPTLHLHPMHFWVKGLSAHNPFLHYLSETGLVGASALILLQVSQFRLAKKNWYATRSITLLPETLILFVISLLFLITTFIEAGWFWGQLAFLFDLFLAFFAQQYVGIYNKKI